MKYVVQTIPHSQQRYQTCGDWKTHHHKLSSVRVSRLGNEDWEFLIGIHEQIEAWLCTKRGISMEQVDRFDKRFEAERMRGLHAKDDEPGDDPHAPYHREHKFATMIENLVAEQLGVDWQAYEKAIESL